MRSDQVSQAFIQSGLENIQGWKVHSLPGQPVPLDCPHGGKTFPLSSLNPSCFILCMLSLIPLP